MPSEHPPPKQAISSPWGDIFLIGGASIIFCIATSVFSPDLTAPFFETDKRLFFVFTLLINWPHFLASYRLIYVGRGNAHPWATRYIPAGLLLLTCAATVLSPWSLYLNGALAAVAFAYLAWHYTGQAFGMMMVFARLDGFSISSRDRALLKLNFRILLFWHVVWFMEGEGGLIQNLFPMFANAYDQWIVALYKTVSIGAACSVLVGLFAFSSIRHANGRLPSIRMWVPWVAIYLWYGLMAKHGVHGIFWVQNFHALQYLAFPLRVELNRYRTQKPRRSVPPTAYIIAYYIFLVLLTLLLLSGALRGIGHVLSVYVGPEMLGSTFVATFISCFNIHHYVIDQVAWKLRNPSVQRDLFSHLAQGQSSEPS